jgi:hypothetical protein
VYPPFTGFVFLIYCCPFVAAVVVGGDYGAVCLFCICVFDCVQRIAVYHPPVDSLFNGDRICFLFLIRSCFVFFHAWFF